MKTLKKCDVYKTMVAAYWGMPSSWDGCFEAALDGWTESPGSFPGKSCLLLSLLPTLGVPLPSGLPGPAAGKTFASEVASCTPGLTQSV